MLGHCEDPKVDGSQPSPTVQSLEQAKEIVTDGPQHLENKEVPTITLAMRRKGWVQFAALCYAIYVSGWNDGTLGPLLPRLQEVYHVGYAVVSLIFITNCIGFFLGASTYLYVTDRFGYGSTVVAASFILAIGNSLQASGAPFPVFVIAYTFAGYGGAFLQGRGLERIPRKPVRKHVHQDGNYARHLRCWCDVCAPRLHAICASAALVLRLPRAHRLSRAQCDQSDDYFQIPATELLAEIGQPPPEKTKDSEAGVNKYKQVFRLRAVHLMAFFIFTYVGVEVTIGGWIVTYIINERHGGANSGYISSGFWGGLTVGRIALLWLNKKVGEWRVVFLYVLIVLGLELVVWQVDALLPSAVCVSFVGFFLGPIYPIVMNHAGTVIPEELISGGIGWISSFGAAGAAAFPFITGAIASGTGIGSLQPLLISMMGLLLVIWAFVPRERVQTK